MAAIVPLPRTRPQRLKPGVETQDKGKHKRLAAAYQQLLQYHENLESPPPLVVCDLERFEVHTKFAGAAKRVYRFTLADPATNAPTPDCTLPPLDVLRATFTAPETLRPDQTAAHVTERAAEFATLAESLRQRGADPERAVHFLTRPPMACDGAPSAVTRAEASGG